MINLNLIDLILLVLSIESLAALIVDSFIFSPLREYLSSINQFLSYSINCHWCTSQQLAFIFSLFIYNPLSHPFLFLILSLISGRLSFLFHTIYIRISTISYDYPDLSSLYPSPSSSNNLNSPSNDLNNDLNNNLNNDLNNIKED